jgi:molybdate transport repressor ModE-like protein
MFKIKIRPSWEITVGAEAPLDTDALLGLLRSVQDSGSIAQAARINLLSYRYAWGLLRDAESQFGLPLLATARGRGTELTPLAQKLVAADRHIAQHLAAALNSFAAEFESELDK